MIVKILCAAELWKSIDPVPGKQQQMILPGMAWQMLMTGGMKKKILGILPYEGKFKKK